MMMRMMAITIWDACINVVVMAVAGLCVSSFHNSVRPHYQVDNVVGDVSLHRMFSSARPPFFFFLRATVRIEDIGFP